jgi:hypothetical protein
MDKGAEFKKNRRIRGPQEPSWLDEPTPRRRGLRRRAPQVEQKPMSPRLMRQLKSTQRDQSGQKGAQGKQHDFGAKKNNQRGTDAKSNGQRGESQKQKGSQRQGEGRGQQ